MAEITYDEFSRLDIRVGRIDRIEEFPEANPPAYKLWIDFGTLGVKTAAPHIASRYTKKDLDGRLVVAVINAPAETISGFRADVRVLGADVADGAIALLRPAADIAPGAIVK